MQRWGRFGWRGWVGNSLQRKNLPRGSLRAGRALAIVVGGALVLGACATASVVGGSRQSGSQSAGPAADAAALQTEGTEVGLASWYGMEYHGKRTASGERFDMEAFTGAHRSLPFGAWVRVTHLATGRAVTVRINDRGPWVEGRVIDLSRRAAEALGILRDGVGRVRVEVVREP